MNKKLAWIFGVGFILIGILGFVPSFLQGGMLFGIFQVDAMLNAVHVLSGGLAIASVRYGARYVRMYFKVFGVVYALLTIIGFVQGGTILGLMTTNMADNLLHLVIAALLLWAGFGRDN